MQHLPIPLPLPLTQENIRPQEDGLKVTQTPRGTRRDERGFHGQHNKSRDAVARRRRLAFKMSSKSSMLPSTHPIRSSVNVVAVEIRYTK